MAIPTPPLGDLTYKSQKKLNEVSLSPRSLEYGDRTGQVRLPEKRERAVFLAYHVIIQYHHDQCNLLKMKYRSILIAVQLTIVAKDLNLRKEKIVVMMITHYNQYHDYFGSQSKKLTSAAAALPWMVCSEPRLGSSPQWSTTEETWHEVDEDFDQDDHDD